MNKQCVIPVSDFDAVLFEGTDSAKAIRKQDWDIELKRLTDKQDIESNSSCQCWVPHECGCWE
jgi:hypothetical protein